MGSFITLNIGEFEIDWGKNYMYRDYSKLFHPTDKKNIRYYYADDIVEEKIGFSKKLKDVKSRLELLGYSIHNLQIIYKNHLDDWPEYDSPINVSFEELRSIFSNISIQEYKDNIEKAGYNISSEDMLDSILESKLFAPLCVDLNDDDISYFNAFFENLDVLYFLRLFMENPENLNLDLEWRTADVIESGYAAENIYTGVEDNDKILIVTEGTTDTFIIKKAIELLRPDILEFFTFIDMEENYPFSGTGNLFRFCQGLSSIKIQNKILVIFDNDLEGVYNFDRVKKLKFPKNMNAMRLPYCKEFEHFLTIGVSDVFCDNINNRAVAIECFLDFSKVEESTPRVRWTNYVEKQNDYQGALENKENYILPFKSLKYGDPYDFSKIEFLLNEIYQNSIRLI